jgi:hypothetical protein
MLANLVFFHVFGDHHKHVCVRIIDDFHIWTVVCKGHHFAALDVRVDKTHYIGRYMLGFYLDVQNITGSKFKEPDAIVSTGVIENPSAPRAEQRYVMKYIKQESGTVLPTIGVTFEF